MANQEQLAILRKGVKTWNKWREEKPDILVDLSGADLSDENLGEIDFHIARLIGTNFSAAFLEKANFNGAVLKEANFNRAQLGGANLTGVKLEEASLIGANLLGVNFSMARLQGANFSNARMGLIGFIQGGVEGITQFQTTFGSDDLSVVKGLEIVEHSGASIIDVGTIYQSKGNIPEVFLRGCGVPENFITFMHSLTGKAFEFYSCFISYSSQDSDFAERLHADLQSKGVRVWLAPQDLKVGDNFRTRIDEAIRVFDKLLVVFSKNSINSGWVKKEVEVAFEKEKRQNRVVLFPVRLDESVLETNKSWVTKFRRNRHIGDFVDWKNSEDSYHRAFSRLLRDLAVSASTELEEQNFK
jgi:hypothetical protein